MEIKIEPHTLERAMDRGVTKKEIEKTINEGIEISAKYGRLCKYKIFDYNDVWNDKFYEHKKVEIVYIIEEEKIITITLFAYYGKWETDK